MATYIPPKRATAFVFYTALTQQADTKLLKANPTLAANDVQISKDGGAFANPDTLPDVDPDAGYAVKVSLTGTEMTADTVTVYFHDASGGEWCDQFIAIQTVANQIDDLATPGAAMTISGTLTTLDAIWAKIQKWLRLALRKDAATATDCATELTELNADGGSGAGAYANTSDAQEATRDQGDSAWITAVGFNTTVPDAAGTAASLVSDLQTHGDSEWATAVGFNTVEPDPDGTAGTLIGDLETHGDGAWATATGFNTTTPDAAGTAATLVSNLQTHGDSEWATADVSGLSTFAPGTDEMESGITWTEFARALGAVLGGVASGGGTTTVVFKALDDSDTTRVTATVDEDGNRSVVTLTLS